MEVRIDFGPIPEVAGGGSGAGLYLGTKPANSTEWYGTPSPKNNYFTEMCSGSGAVLYLRRIECVYHPTLGLRVIKKKKESAATQQRATKGSYGQS